MRSLALALAAALAGASVATVAIVCTVGRRRTEPGVCPAAGRPGPHLCGPLCEEWLRVEEVASLARQGHVDRAGAVSQLETYAWHAQALGETAQARAAELRR